jgi:putative Mn2+ efflux pump MntP
LPSYLAAIVLVLSLGIDTLLISTSLGVIRTAGKWRIAAVFACAEAVMPFIGLAIGQAAGRYIGEWASLIGGVLLVGVASWLLVIEKGEDERIGRQLIGWTLIATAVSISLDELAVGFSIGLLGVPVLLTVALIALQAFVFTLIGIALGSRLQPYLGEWAEKLSGAVLGLLGLWTIVHAFLK